MRHKIGGGKSFTKKSGGLLLEVDTVNHWEPPRTLMVVTLEKGLNGYSLQTADQSSVRKRLRTTERVCKLNAFRKATVLVFLFFFF